MTMKFVKGVGLLALSMFIFSCNGKKEESKDEKPSAKQHDTDAAATTTAKPNQDKKNNIVDHLPTNHVRLHLKPKSKKKYKVNAKKGAIFSHNAKYKVVIPQNSFIDSKGNVVKGEVNISFEDLNTPEAIIAQDIPMEYEEGGNKHHFKSAGMFRIKGETNKGERIQIAPNKKLEVHSYTQFEESEFNFYQFSDDKRKWNELQKNVEIVQVDLALEKQPQHSTTSENPEIGNLNSEEDEDVEKVEESQTTEVPEDDSNDNMISDDVLKTTTQKKVTERKTKVSSYAPELAPYDPNYKSFDLVYEQGGTAYEGVIWQYDAKSGYPDPEKTDGVFTTEWTKADLSLLSTRRNQYLLVLSKEGKVFKTVVHPTALGKNVAVAGDVRKEIQRQKWVQKRVAFISSFGMYNWDRYYKDKKSVQAQALVAVNGSAIENGTQVFLITDNDETVIRYSKFDLSKFSYRPKIANKLIVLLKDNSVATFSSQEFNELDHAEVRLGSQITFNLTTCLKLESQSQLKSVIEEL